jgi:DNA-binding response OmpR family regulator
VGDEPARRRIDLLVHRADQIRCRVSSFEFRVGTESCNLGAAYHLKPETRNPKRVLIAEDEPNIIISLEFLLKGAGYEVAVAKDGGSALHMIERLRPDLVVLDLMLPSVNGFEVCRRIREAPESKATKVLMLTARGRQSEVEIGMAAGANAYMTKPFATRELMKTVADLLASDDVSSER